MIEVSPLQRASAPKPETARDSGGIGLAGREFAWTDSDFDRV